MHIAGIELASCLHYQDYEEDGPFYALGIIARQKDNKGKDTWIASSTIISLGISVSDALSELASVRSLTAWRVVWFSSSEKTCRSYQGSALNFRFL